MKRWAPALACCALLAAVGGACLGGSEHPLGRVVVWLQLPKVPPWLQRSCAAYVVLDQMYSDHCVPVAEMPDCVDIAAHRYAFQSAAQGLLMYTHTEVK